MNLCLRNVSNLLDLEYFCLKMLCVHSKCMGMMDHRLAQKRGIWRFSGGIGCILLDYQAKSWMVGRYAYSTVQGIF